MNAPPSGARGVTRSVVLMTAGCALLAVNDSIMKSVASSYPPGESIFFRGLFVIIPIGAIAFGDWPQPTMLAGAVLVVGSGLYILHREARPWCRAPARSGIRTLHHLRLRS